MPRAYNKAKQKVTDWGGYLCGIINEQEQPKSPERAQETRKMNSLQALMENQHPENEYIVQVREERLSRMLLTEVQHIIRVQLKNYQLFATRDMMKLFYSWNAMIISIYLQIFENEYKWNLYEDEKAEVVMELADLVFEELVEELVDDITNFN